MPPLRPSHKNVSRFCGSPVQRGNKGGIVKIRASFLITIPQSQQSQGRRERRMASPWGVSRALCAAPRCGVCARRTEVFAIVGKNLDRWRRRSLRRRDRCRQRRLMRGTVKKRVPSAPPHPSGSFLACHLPPRGKAVPLCKNAWRSAQPNATQNAPCRDDVLRYSPQIQRRGRVGRNTTSQNSSQSAATPANESRAR